MSGNIYGGDQDTRLEQGAEFEAECPFCRGHGWTTGSAHDPNCDGSCRNCPVPVQEQCEFCGGAGYFVSVSA